MRKLRENAFFVALALLTVFLQGPLPVFADNDDIAAWGGSGTYNAVDVWKIDQDRDLRSYNGNIILGNNGIAPSQTNYYGIKLPCTTVEALTVGDLVISSNTGTGYCRKGTATTDLVTVLGIADGTYAANATAYYTAYGYALAKTTGTVSIGDPLVSTTSAAGYLTGDTTPTSGARVGIALKAGTVSGGTIPILVTH